MSIRLTLVVRLCSCCNGSQSAIDAQPFCDRFTLLRINWMWWEKGPRADAKQSPTLDGFSLPQANVQLSRTANDA